MFRELITSADGTTAEGACPAEQAERLLRTAIRRGYRMEATPKGGVIITRDVHTGTPIPRKHAVEIEPVTPAGSVTQTMRSDLALIEARTRHTPAHLREGSGRIDGLLFSIPPAAAARLVQRGLVAVEGTAVSVSLAARLAMLAQDHRTTTSEPRGYVRPSILGLNTAGLNKPGGRCGKVYDGGSVASCSCASWSWPCEDRYRARQKAHEHRQQVTAAMVRELLNL